MEGYASCAETDLVNSCRTFHVLVGVTGSVAALKLPLLVSQLLQLPGVDVRVVSTEHAKHFYNPAEVSVKIYSDKDEWEMWKQRSDPVLHIELRRWADLLVIAPLDANTLGKMVNGICDNLLMCVVRAWDMSRPLLFCPAMNTAMWLHPITAEQVSRMKEFGYVEIPCIAKKLVCGDVGKGAMAEVPFIVSVVKQYLHKSESSIPCRISGSLWLGFLVKMKCVVGVIVRKLLGILHFYTSENTTGKSLQNSEQASALPPASTQTPPLS